MPNQATIEGKSVTSVRATDSHIRSLLRTLDTDDRRMQGEDTGASTRYAYRHPRIKVAVEQLKSDTIVFVAPTRTISTEDVTFLHGGFLHVKTRCKIELITALNEWNCEEGLVTSCEHVEGSIHEITVRFDIPINVARYARASITTRVLLVDDDPSIVRLVQFHLKDLNTHLEVCQNGREAVATAQNGVFDIVLMDVEMPVLDGNQAVRELRSAGYSGRIFAVTARTEPEDRQKCIRAGFDGFVAKPVSREGLVRLLEDSKTEPLVSSFSSNPEMVPLINDYVAELPAKIRALESAVVKGDIEQLELCARSMKGEASSYGFEPITEAAAKLEASVLQKYTIDVLKPQVEELISWCSKVRYSAAHS